jgi:3-dehydroquinate synthetase
MGTDKKIRDGKLRLVLPHAIGHVEIAQDVAREEIERALTESYPV